MSSFQTLVTWASTKTEEYLAKVITTLGINNSSGTDTPDENGLVALTGLDPASHWAKFRYAILEVSNSLPPGSMARITSYYNCWNANGSFGLYPECRVVQETDNPITGGKNYELTSVYIPNAIALPFDMTVAAATEKYKNMPEPTTSSGNFSVG